MGRMGRWGETRGARLAREAVVSKADGMSNVWVTCALEREETKSVETKKESAARYRSAHQGLASEARSTGSTQFLWI